MSARSPWGLYLVALVVVFALLLAPSGPTGRTSEAALAAPPPQATVQPGAGRVGRSPTVLGDINNDGIVDILDYGLWRQQFGATGCGNPADLNGTCLVDILDYAIWRQQFGQTGPTLTPTPTPSPTATPTLPGRAYVANFVSANVTVIDTTTNTVVGAPIPVGTSPQGVGIGP